MDFGWSEGQQRYVDSVTRFAAEQLAGGDDLIRRDAEQVFWRDGWRRCAGFGVPGLPIPAEYGGVGADRLTVIAAMEALGRHCRDNGLLFALNAHMWGAALPILTFGTEPQRRRYLPGLCDGSLLGALAVTEPGSGSDAYAMKATATPGDGGYLLNGTKTYITNAPIADVVVVVASSNPSAGFAALSAFVLDKDTPGLRLGPPMAKMGLRTATMGEVTLTDCRVSEEQLLGRAGAGLSVFTVAMDWERSCILASAVGTMRRLLDRCVGYARERTQFGQPIGQFQAVSHKLVEMKLRLETSRLLLYRLGWLHGTGQRVTGQAALAKLHVAESLVQTTQDALQVHGAYGYLTDTELEREVRDALAARLYSGTSEIQRNIVARDLGL